MNHDDFIDLAGKLIANSAAGRPEARFRSAVSRAYYGVFHCALAVLDELGMQIPGNHQGHQEAYRVLYNTGVREAVEAAHRLNELRGERNEADYRLNRGRFAKLGNAKLAVESAIHAVAVLQACLQEPLRTRLREQLTK